MSPPGQDPPAVQAPPIGGDPSGATTAADPRRAAAVCSACPKLCRHVCPAARATANEAHLPSVKTAAWRRIDAGHDPPEPTVLRTLFACSDCNASTRYCRHDVEPAPTLAAGRAFALARGAAPAAVARLAAALGDDGRPYPLALPETLARHVGGAQLTAEVVYHPGCTTLREHPAAVAAACRLLAASGRPFQLRADLCSGAPAAYAGRVELAAELARRQAARLPVGATLVSSCPQAVTTYLRAGLPAVHLATHLATAELPLTARPAGRYTFHDPCHLARHQADPRSARVLLDRALAGERREPVEHGPETSCCGGGGLLPASFGRAARRLARDRQSQLDRALDGDGTIVTACPSCRRQLARGSRHPVRDLAELLVDALPR